MIFGIRFLNREWTPINANFIIIFAFIRVYSRFLFSSKFQTHCIGIHVALAIRKP